MKANFIIGKKQIILASLIVVLGAAVYLNWVYANKDGTDLTEDVINTTEDLQLGLEEVGNLEATDKDASKEDDTDKNDENDKKDETKNMGDSILVDSLSVAADEYFAMAKLNKLKSRDMAIETINTILNDENSSQKDKDKLSDTAIQISNNIEVETKLENLIKAKGIEECVVYINDKNASVVVKSNGLTKDLATQIKNIVLSEGNILGENIAITELAAE